jgi:cbb3-type cytochrome oxidase cytochrome c subunit
MEDCTEKIIQKSKEYIEKVIKDGKPYCPICFDTRDITKIDGCFFCQDCLYIQKMLDEVKKI